MVGLTCNVPAGRGRCKTSPTEEPRSHLCSCPAPCGLPLLLTEVSPCTLSDPACEVLGGQSRMRAAALAYVMTWGAAARSASELPVCACGSMTSIAQGSASTAAGTERKSWVGKRDLQAGVRTRTGQRLGKGRHTVTARRGQKCPSRFHTCLSHG